MPPRRRGEPMSSTNVVVVVNDHPELRELLTRYVIRSGLIAVPVPDGAQAAIMCETLKPDLILVDLMLPHFDGLALIGRLRAQCAGTPLVVIASRLDSDRDAQCRTAGADDVLPKPLDLTHLGRTLSRLLHSPASRRRILTAVTGRARRGAPAQPAERLASDWPTTNGKDGRPEQHQDSGPGAATRFHTRQSC
jgi:DNA-binding response OmpR family regulator